MIGARRTLQLVMLVAVAAMMVPWLAMVATSMLTTGDTVARAAAARLQIIGSGMVRDIEAYVRAGVPMEDIVGLGEYMSGDLVRTEEVQTAWVETAGGQVLDRYVRADRSDLKFRDLSSATDWAAMGLQIARFPITLEGRSLGQLLLAYQAHTPPSVLERMGGDFVVVMATMLAIGAQVVLAAWRETLVLPLRTLTTLERRVARHGYDRIAASASGGPLAAVVEALNRLIVGVNDRYAMVRAYLAEIRQYSFNPRAASVAVALERRLDEAGRFAPDGLDELQVSHGDLFAGPVAFRAAMLVGLVWGSAASLNADGSAAAGMTLAAAACAGGGAAAKTVLGFAARLRVGIGVAAGLAGLAAMALLPWYSAVLVGAGLVTAAALAIASTVAADSAVGKSERAVHTALGYGAGGGIVAIGTGLVDLWAPLVAALLALISLSVMALRFPSAGVARRPVLSAGPLPTVALVLPAWLSCVAAGIWIIGAAQAMLDPQATVVERPGILLWGGGLLMAGGGALMIAAMHRWRTQALADAVTLAVPLLLATLVTMVPGSVWGASMGAAVVGLGYAAAAAILAARPSTRLAVPALGLALGALIGALLAATGSSGVLATALWTVAVASAVPSVWLLRHGSDDMAGGAA